MSETIFNGPVFEKVGRGRPPVYGIEAFDVGDYVVVPKEHVPSQRNRVRHLNATDLVGRQYQVVRIDEYRWALQRVS